VQCIDVEAIVDDIAVPVCVGLAGLGYRGYNRPRTMQFDSTGPALKDPTLEAEGSYRSRLDSDHEVIVTIAESMPRERNRGFPTQR
jgi:hypothetical protein